MVKIVDSYFQDILYLNSNLVYNFILMQLELAARLGPFDIPYILYRDL